LPRTWCHRDLERADLPAYLVGRAALVGRRDNGDRHRFSNRTDHGPNDIGTSRLHLVRACEASLRRLKTDYIDLYQVHRPDRRTPTQETLWALDESGPRRQGSLSRRRQFLRTGDLQKFLSAQDHYSLMFRDIEKPMEPFCVKYGMGMNSYFQLAGGLLTGKYRRQPTRHGKWDAQEVGRECTALEMRLHPFRPVVSCSARLCFVLIF
jgi:aryl-alcohol dehydrogenase-like predicted oxidoreductase